MTDRSKKIFVGFILFFIVGLWFFIAHNRSVNQQQKDDFYLNAYFVKTDGLNIGAPVRLSGIPVGHVYALDFADNYLVKVTLSFDEELELPIDSSVAIETDGILGTKHVELIAGADDELLNSGDDLSYTQDVLLLDELLEKINTYMASKKQVQPVKLEQGEEYAEESN